MKLKFSGTCSYKEASELLAFEGLEKMFKNLNLDTSADICRQILEFASANIEVMNDSSSCLGEDQTVILDDPADTAAMFRKFFEEQKKNPEKRVGNSMISKGTTIGKFKIAKNSCIPEPRPSLPQNIRQLYDNWLESKIINSEGILTRDMEVSSRNVAVGIALGYSASANLYLPKEMDWK